MSLKDLTIKSIPSSFVFNDMKLLTDKGAGEAKLFVGSKSNEEQYDSFFDFENGYTYKFQKDNVLEYLLQVKMEYVFQKINRYKNASLIKWNELYNEIKSLDETKFTIHLKKYVDDKRYYIRSEDWFFSKAFRKFVIPKLSDLVFIKDELHKIIFLKIQVNYEFENNVLFSEQELQNGSVLSIEEKRIVTGTNVLLYGVPGSGKSWTIEHEYCNKNTKVERLVFHPDYTYSDFIGQILPNVDEEGQVSYKFTPGPFTNILAEAYANPLDEYILVIEEINRGNAPAIFGEVFQLLDRKSEINEYNDDGYPIGTSEYGITNANIASVVYGDSACKIRIPSNLSIIATMNTSDQNVFTLDTAFQRRWEMRLIENNFDHVDKKLANAQVLDTTITWKAFCIEINKIIVGNSARMTSSEDKRLGAYFVNLKDLIYDDKMGNLSDGEYDFLRTKEQENTISSDEKARLEEIRSAMKQNRKFPEKVIKYLWDDAFKFNREIIFETNEFQSLEQVIRAFMYSNGFERFLMFKENIRNAFISPKR